MYENKKITPQDAKKTIASMKTITSFCIEVKMKYLLFALVAFAFQVQAEEKIDCKKAISTPDVNYCIGLELDKKEAVLEKYLAKSIERHSYDDVTVNSLKKSQQTWLKYREDYCNAIYDYWREGTIRGAMFLNCKIRLTKLRTHVIWSDYLTFMDSSEPVLPEPELK